MRLIDLKIRNVLLISRADVNFKTGLYFIEGENKDAPGSDSNQTGKSSLIEAFVWCWFGKTIRNISADEICNNKLEKDCEVTNSFEKDENVYRIERGRSYGKNGKPSLKIFMNGEDVTPASNPQDLINSLVGVSYETFLTVCVFSSNTKKFDFISKTNSEQKKVIEDLVDFSRFREYQKATKDKIKNLELRENTFKQDKIKLTERDSNLDNESIRLCGWIKDVEAKASKVHRPMETIQLELTDGESYLGQLEGEHTAASNKYIKYRTAAAGHKTSVDQYTEDLRLLKVSQSQKNCPTCGQEMPRQDYSDLIQQAKNLLTSTTAAYDKAVLGRDKFKTVRDELQEETTNLKARISRLRAELSLAREEVGDAVKYKERLNLISQEKIDIKEQKAIIDENIGKISTRLDRYKFLEQAFSRNGVESYLLDQVLPFLNERANFYVSELSDGRISLSFATLKETRSGSVRDDFHVKVRASEGGESYGACSGSEERFADIAVALAKRDLAELYGPGIPPILFLDEVFGPVDVVGSGRAVSFLSGLAKKIGTVWFITHNTALKDYFDEKLVVVREGGVSILKEI